MAQYSQT